MCTYLCSVNITILMRWWWPLPRFQKKCDETGFWAFESAIVTCHVRWRNVLPPRDFLPHKLFSM